MIRFMIGWTVAVLGFVFVIWPLATAGAYPVSPVSPTGAAKVYERAEELIDWIAENSDYEPFEPPAIVFVSQPELQYIISFPHEMTGHEDVLAIYVDPLMLLRDSFVLGRDDYVLLHELVHHAQKQEGREFACMAEREKEAYDLQIKFVRETGSGEIPGPLFYALLNCDYGMGDGP